MVDLSFKNEFEMYPVIEDFFKSQGYRTHSQASFKIIKLWKIDVVAYNSEKQELIAVEAKLSLDNALEAVSQAEMYQMACSKVYVAFPHTEWDSKDKREMRKDVEEICKKRGIGIISVIGSGLTESCKEALKPASSLRIDLLESILEEIKRNFKQFPGFDEDDFAFFIIHNELKKETVEKKFKKLMKEIKHSIPNRASFLKDHEIRLQHIRKDYMGINIFKGSKHTRSKHYSIGIGPGLFSVFIQIPINDLVEAFVEKLKSNKKEFLTILGKLPDVDLELYARSSKASHGRPMPGGTIYQRIMIMKTAQISSETAIDELIKNINEIPYRAVNFSKDYDVDELGYSITKEDALDFIFKTLNELNPIYTFIPK